jgi:hypothetical protein
LQDELPGISPATIKRRGTSRRRWHLVGPTTVSEHW